MESRANLRSESGPRVVPDKIILELYRKMLGVYYIEERLKILTRQANRARQDEITMRQLFAPSFVVWLANHPLQPGFELRAGTLVVFLPGECGEAGKLEWLLMAADEIAKRIRLELTDAAQAGSL